jgi:hypothetical protein
MDAQQTTSASALVAVMCTNKTQIKNCVFVTLNFALQNYFATHHHASFLHFV